MLLSRTMAVAFVPGVVAAAVLAILPPAPRRLGDGFLNLGLAAVAAFAVAATWYWRNLDPVMEYLTDFGYGTKAGEYGEHHSVLSWEWWHAVATRITAFDLLVPIAVICFASLIVLAVEVVRRVAASDDRRATVEGLLRRDITSVCIVFAVGYLGLSSSENVGSGFTLPLAVLLPPIAVVALRLHQRVIVPALGVVALVTAVNVVSSSTISESLSKQRTVHVPGFGYLPWVNGIPKAVAAVREQVPGPEWKFDDTDREFVTVNYEIDRYIVDQLGASPDRPGHGIRNPQQGAQHEQPDPGDAPALHRTGHPPCPGPTESRQRSGRVRRTARRSRQRPARGAGDNRADHRRLRTTDRAGGDRKGGQTGPVPAGPHLPRPGRHASADLERKAP